PTAWSRIPTRTRPSARGSTGLGPLVRGIRACPAPWAPLIPAACPACGGTARYARCRTAFRTFSAVSCGFTTTGLSPRWISGNQGEGVKRMHRFWNFARLGLPAILLPLCICSCSEEPPRKLGDPPPGAIGQNDPRWRGIPDEVGNEKGIFHKKIYRKPDKTQP